MHQPYMAIDTLVSVNSTSIEINPAATDALVQGTRAFVAAELI